MPRNQDIQSGLNLLDPSNDDHWTSGGLPRVDVVSTLSSVAGVTRSEITTLAPDLIRDNAPPLTPTDERNPDAGTDIEKEDSGPSVGSGQGDGEEGEKEEPGLSETEALKLQLQSEISACKASISEAMTERDQAIADIRNLEATCQILEVRYNALFPPVPQAESIQAYQERSKAERAARVGRARNAVGSAKSRLDQAMAVRRSFGQNRPEGFLLDGG